MVESVLKVCVFFISPKVCVFLVDLDFVDPVDLDLVDVVDLGR